MALALFTGPPLSKSAPRACCAFIILLVSSSSIGINLNAIDTIIASSCTGTLNIFKNPKQLSIPLVSLFGVVVYVISDDPNTRNASLRPINNAANIPSFVTVNIHHSPITSPGVIRSVNIIINKRRNSIGRSPFNIYFGGMCASVVTVTRNAPASRNPQKDLNRNKDTTNIIVPKNFVLGSSLCITDSTG